MSKKNKEMIERTETCALQWNAELNLKKKKGGLSRGLIRSYKYLCGEEKFVNAGLLSL